MKNKNTGSFRFLAGVDEAGRGPLAGPLAVGVVIVPIDFDWDMIPGVGDSKKVTEKNREAIFLRAGDLERRSVIRSHVALVSARFIDTHGITKAVETGIQNAFAKLSPDPARTQVKLDGLLSAPLDYTHQETIVRGDASEKVIGLASILAKVTRDRVMRKLDSRYPQYGFSQHKGYGTVHHRACIAKYGCTSEHRVTFCSRCVSVC